MNKKTVIALLGASTVAFIIACANPNGPNAKGIEAKPSGQATTATAPSTPAAGPLTSFGDGQFKVGTKPGQIAPGTYVTVVPANSKNCYWERERSLSGDIDAIIVNGNVKPGSQVFITIEPNDKGFNSHGCGTWKLDQ